MNPFRLSDIPMALFIFSGFGAPDSEQLSENSAKYLSTKEIIAKAKAVAGSTMTGVMDNPTTRCLVLIKHGAFGLD